MIYEIITFPMLSTFCSSLSKATFLLHNDPIIMNLIWWIKQRNQCFWWWILRTTTISSISFVPNLTYSDAFDNISNLTLSTFSGVLIVRFRPLVLFIATVPVVLNAVTRLKMVLRSEIDPWRRMLKWVRKSRCIWLIDLPFSKYRRTVDTHSLNTPRHVDN